MTTLRGRTYSVRALSGKRASVREQQSLPIEERQGTDLLIISKHLDAWVPRLTKLAPCVCMTEIRKDPSACAI